MQETVVAYMVYGIPHSREAIPRCMTILSLQTMLGLRTAQIYHFRALERNGDQRVVAAARACDTG